MSSVRDWQDRVPIVSYDDLQPWVQRAAAGEPCVLTTAPVRIFERTSGSTAASKLVPYTAALFDEFAAATGPWLHDLFASVPRLRGTTSYWSISPATRQPERTPGGVPIPTPGADPSGHGEGAVFLGTVMPNKKGKFNKPLPPVQPGTLISATATDADGNTSEFAENIEAQAPGS